MSTDGSWSDERIHAYVDGELPAQEAGALRAAMQADAALRTRVERQQRLRGRLDRAFDTVLDEPVPDRLLQAIAGRTTAVTPIGAASRAKPSRARPQPLWWAAAAASVVFAALIGWNLPRSATGEFTQRDGVLLASGALADALTGELSAAGTATARVVIPLSFRTRDGRYCRAFALASGTDGVACREGGGWRIEATGRSSTGRSPEAYRQAASSLSAAALGEISRQQAGDALTSEEERSARADDWRCSRGA